MSIRSRTLRLQPLFVLVSLVVLVAYVVDAGGTEAGEGRSSVLEQSVYFKNFVRHADGEFCTHVPPVTGYIAYLNGNLGTILANLALRLDGGTDPNIPGNGVFGVELGDFRDPQVAPGDSIFILFSCRATQQQGLLRAQVDQIPWHYFPQTLNLSPVDLPGCPRNVSVQRDVEGRLVVRWEQMDGMRYDVYRRALTDTLSDGRARYQYERVACDVQAGAWIDSSATDSAAFAYIVFSKNDQGVLSLPSPEASEFTQITGLEGAPRATSVILKWCSPERPREPVRGYNIYRRRAGEDFGFPVAFTGPETSFVDSRLEPGTKYWYKVAARTSAGVEIGQSEEILVQTSAQTRSYYRFATLRVAVVIYQNTNRGRIEDSDVPRIRAMLENARLFYWRNSGMKLNLQLSYFLIGDYREFGDPNDPNVTQTVEDLSELGVMNTQYDIIFRLTPAVNGYWSFGVMKLNLPGPERATGFSHSTWPYATGVLFPGPKPNGLTWIFVHEVQHAIDALYDANGHPEMYHGDRPWEFPVPCGEHFDFQAKMLRHFNDYEDLIPGWGGIWEAVDSDRDGFPDDDPSLPLDELRFGSNPHVPDTDGDGYSDREEALDGIFFGSDPNLPDTDGDGVQDGQDPYPRYPIPAEITNFEPKIDGHIESTWPLVDDTLVFSTTTEFRARLYLAYSPDSFYLAMDLSRYAVPTVFLDLQADGWWFSSGNLKITVHPEGGGWIDVACWDASPEVRRFSLARGGPGGMWDTDPVYQSHFHHRVIPPQSIHTAVVFEPPRIQVEMAIPRTTYAGLFLRPGDRIRVNVRYHNIDRNRERWATTFDLYGFATFTFGSLAAVAGEPSSFFATDFKLVSNYPNPFGKATQILFQTAGSGSATLVIFNSLGQKVFEQHRHVEGPGFHRFRWDGRDFLGKALPAGVYLYRVRFGQRWSKGGKLVLFR